MTEVTVGEMYTFKKTATRGRPFVGTVVKRQGMYVVMETKKGETMFVKPERLIAPYSFKPYMTRARKAAAA